MIYHLHSSAITIYTAFFMSDTSSQVWALG
jgi:hypothetical protein